MRSTRTRLALVLRVFAIARMRFATRVGSETLCRTDSVLFMELKYTSLHHFAWSGCHLGTYPERSRAMGGVWFRSLADPMLAGQNIGVGMSPQTTCAGGVSTAVTEAAAMFTLTRTKGLRP
jgi:hypothetical protein